MLLAGVCFSSCSKDDGGGDNGNISEKLVGLWIETEDYWDGELEKYSGNEFESFYEFKADDTIVQLYYGNGCSYSNGYVYGIDRNDLEYDSMTMKYKIIDDIIWTGDIKICKVIFINNDKIKLEWAEDAFTQSGDYSIYERVKGFK